MADATNIDLEFRLGRSGHKLVPTSAYHLRLNVLRVNVLFHGNSLIISCNSHCLLYSNGESQKGGAEDFLRARAKSNFPKSRKRRETCGQPPPPPKFHFVALGALCCCARLHPAALCLEKSASIDNSPLIRDNHKYSFHDFDVCLTQFLARIWIR